MLTRRRLFSAVTALVAAVVTPLKAKAAEWGIPDLKLFLIHIPRDIPRDQESLVSYLEAYMQCLTQRMDLTEGCELTVRFYDQKDAGFGIPEDLRDIQCRYVGGNLNFSAVFLLALQATEDLLTRKDSKVLLFSSTQDIEASDRFRAQVESVSVKIRAIKPKPGPASWQGLFRVVKLHQK